MRTSDFDFQVPRELIAQEPLTPRDSSRLLVIDRQSGKLEHHKFNELPLLLNKGDCLVFNNSRVIPARLRGTLRGEPMTEIVVVLLRRWDAGVWEALVEVGTVGLGDVVDFRGFDAEVVEVKEKVGKREERLVNLLIRDERRLAEGGEVPVPPYIHGYKGDPERYQTVYSKIRGSAAAPTAGLHFTNELLDRLQLRGVIFCFVTLHVGLDTFMPVLEDTPQEHKMYTELAQLDRQVASKLNEVRYKGGRIIGVGTTSVRTMESASTDGIFSAYNDWTSLYILPGYTFKSIDGMITNFHYPRSTNLMMVASLVGLERLRAAYEEAVKEKYRFYSFGDACLIL